MADTAISAPRLCSLLTKLAYEACSAAVSHPRASTTGPGWRGPGLSVRAIDRQQELALGPELELGAEVVLRVGWLDRVRDQADEVPRLLGPLPGGVQVSATVLLPASANFATAVAIRRAACGSSALAFGVTATTAPARTGTERCSDGVAVARASLCWRRSITLVVPQKANGHTRSVRSRSAQSPAHSVARRGPARTPWPCRDRAVGVCRSARRAPARPRTR